MFSYRKSLTIEEMEAILSRRASERIQMHETESRAGRSQSSRVSLTPYSKQFAQRMSLIRQQRLDRSTEREKDVLASRHLGTAFHTPSADLSAIHPSRRSFGSAKPASRSLSPSMSGDRSRSRTRSEDNTRSRSLSRVSRDFASDLQYMKDSQAAKLQEDSLLEVKKQYYLELLKKKLQSPNPTPWVPTGKGEDKKSHFSTKSSFADKSSVSEKKRIIRDKLLVDRAMRRAPWPGRTAVEETTQGSQEGAKEARGRSRSVSKDNINKLLPHFQSSVAPEEVNGVVNHHSESFYTPPSSPRRSVESGKIGVNNASAAASTKDKSASPASLPAPKKPILLSKSSPHLALTIRIVDSQKTKSADSSANNSNNNLTSKSRYGILVIRRGDSIENIIHAFEKQFSCHQRVSDLSLAKQQSYSKTISVCSLSLGTLPDPPPIDEESDLVVYINGGKWEGSSVGIPGQGLAYSTYEYVNSALANEGGLLFSQPLRDYQQTLWGGGSVTSRGTRASHGVGEGDGDRLFFDSMSNHIAAFDNYTRTLPPPPSRLHSNNPHNSSHTASPNHAEAPVSIGPSHTHSNILQASQDHRGVFSPQKGKLGIPFPTLAPMPVPTLSTLPTIPSVLASKHESDMNEGASLSLSPILANETRQDFEKDEEAVVEQQGLGGTAASSYMYIHDENAFRQSLPYFDHMDGGLSPAKELRDPEEEQHAEHDVVKTHENQVEQKIGETVPKEEMSPIIVDSEEMKKGESVEPDDLQTGVIQEREVEVVQDENDRELEKELPSTLEKEDRMPHPTLTTTGLTIMPPSPLAEPTTYERSMRLEDLQEGPLETPASSANANMPPVKHMPSAAAPNPSSASTASLRAQRMEELYKRLQKRPRPTPSLPAHCTFRPHVHPSSPRHPPPSQNPNPPPAPAPLSPSQKRAMDNHMRRASFSSLDSAKMSLSQELRNSLNRALRGEDLVITSTSYYPPPELSLPSKLTDGNATSTIERVPTTSLFSENDSHSNTNSHSNSHSHSVAAVFNANSRSELHFGEEVGNNDSGGGEEKVHEVFLDLS
eukprot:gene29227-35279_t